MVYPLAYDDTIDDTADIVADDDAWLLDEYDYDDEKDSVISMVVNGRQDNFEF